MTLTIWMKISMLIYFVNMCVHVYKICYSGCSCPFFGDISRHTSRYGGVAHNTAVDCRPAAFCRLSAVSCDHADRRHTPKCGREQHFKL